jgi:uncharacterized protein (DUF1684 family)
VVAASDLRSDTGRAFAQVSWKPVSRLSLEAGSAIESLGVAVQGAAGGAAAYAYMTPHLAATFTPWTDAALAFSAERKVSAPNAAQFASFIQTADHPGADAFQPDHEWRYSASFKQALGPEAAMSASFTQSNLQSVTDLGPVGAGQAPVDIGPGERRQVNLAVVAPLLLPGLSAPAKLSASADWLASDVTDPFTG